MSMIDLAFPLMSVEPIPADHGYPLYSALSRLLPDVHKANGIAVHPIRGTQIGNRQLNLNDRSRLALRTDTDSIGELIQLAGKQMNIAGSGVRIGVPQVWALRPATALRSRLVIIKVKDAPTAADLTEDIFTAALRRQLDSLGVSSEARITIPMCRAGTPRRRTLRIKDKEIVGYEVILEGLTAEESLNIQERGLGGRRHMGCGVFAPFGTREQGSQNA